MASQSTHGVPDAVSGGISPSSTFPLVSEARLHSAVILMVDDDLLSCATTSATLAHYGFQKLQTVNDGESALRWVERQTPDMIILDILLPDIHGLQLCKRLRERPELRDVPILVYTALQDEQARLSLFGMGASDLVLKSITPQELIARCRIHLEHRYILKDLSEYREKMEADLANARAMQNMLMPDEAQIAAIREEYGLDIHSLFAPSSAIGGDFWGIHPFHGTGRLAIYIGDFTGHGITAALNVFRLSTLIGKLPEGVLSHPGLCMRELNQQLHAILPTELFATMFYAVLDTEADCISYCMAGCPPPLILHADGSPSHTVLEGSGLPLAAIRTPNYHERQVSFRSGDALLLYSDAVIETPTIGGGYISISDIASSLEALPAAACDAKCLLSATLEYFRAHTGDNLHDDLTLNVYRRL